MRHVWLHFVHLKNCVVASSADLVCSIHQNAMSCLQCGHSMLVVGSASMVSPSITVSEPSELVFLLSCFLVFSSCPLLVLKPHFGHAIISSPGSGRRRVSHFGQKRKTENPVIF